MNSTLIKALVALVPAFILVSGSALLFIGRKSAPSLLQLVGAGGLMTVALAHICEGLRLFPSMQWGMEH